MQKIKKMRNNFYLIVFVGLISIDLKETADPLYLGCFKDCYSGTNGININLRDIQFFVLGSSMTNQICIDKCTSLNFLYAATQYG